METTTIIIIIIICICISSSIGIGIYLSSSSEPPNETDSDTGENTSGAAGTSATSAAPAASGTSVNASGTSVAARGTSVFKVIGSNDTNFDDEGGGNTIYLDRQNVNCKDNAIKRFHLSREYDKDTKIPTGKMKYEVSCSSGDLGSATNKDTGANDWGGGNTIYLDRHNIDCGSDSVLTQFRLIRPSESQIRYDYTCKKSNKSLTCRDVNTPANDWGGGNSIFLDRHDVSCNENEVLSQVHLTRPTGGEISYKYKCCKY